MEVTEYQRSYWSETPKAGGEKRSLVNSNGWRERIRMINIEYADDRATLEVT